MDIQEYINSGILHDYCINALSDTERAGVEQVCARYPEVKKELQQMQRALEKFAERTSEQPADGLKQTIWNTLENINKERAGELDDLPLLNKYSDHNNWNRIVKPLIPRPVPEKRVVIPLRSSDGIMQCLIISRTDVDDETHIHERESFLVLEGECECHIGDNVYRLGPGGFLDVPLHQGHNVKVLSPYVVAVLQHVAV